MSWYGCHPVISRVEGRRQLAALGLAAPCTRCLYWYRLYLKVPGACSNCRNSPPPYQTTNPTLPFGCMDSDPYFTTPRMLR